MMNRQHLSKRLRRLPPCETATDLVHLAAREFFAEQDAAEQERRKAEGKDLKKNPYISDADSECDRAVVYSLMNVPATDAPDLQGFINLEVGRRVESMVGDFFSSAGYEPVGQERIEIPAGATVVTGRPDFILRSPDGRDLVEVKKVKVYALNDNVLQHGPGLGERGVRQGNLYVHGARHGVLGEDLVNCERVMLVWVLTESVKGEPGLFAWWKPYNPDAAASDLGRLERLYRMAMDGVLPDPPAPRNIKKRWNYTWGSWPCAWCSYRARCYDDVPENRRGGSGDKQPIFAT